MVAREKPGPRSYNPAEHAEGQLDQIARPCLAGRASKRVLPGESPNEPAPWKSNLRERCTL
jgi:hypothetical protein